MKCPYCEKEIPGITCPDCGAVTPEEAQYCMKCGSLLTDHSEDRPEETDSWENEESLDMDDRVLCPDGTCTGIIVDGRCTECGEPFVSDEEVKAEGEGDGPHV
jgi:DNA-directed RNA polymerase subunit RPC12/RpoP